MDEVDASVNPGSGPARQIRRQMAPGQVRRVGRHGAGRLRHQEALEQAKLWPTTAADAAAWTFDPIAQTWTKP